jgi:hypothetical protein
VETAREQGGDLLERVLGLKPLSEENQIIFQRMWKWFIDRGLTDKEEPQVACSKEISYHLDGLIGIDESQGNEAFPLAGVMLEETLHYVLTSDDPKTSADFSPEFLQGILRIITGRLDGQPEKVKREFQSILIRYLWELIERRPC